MKYEENTNSEITIHQLVAVREVSLNATSSKRRRWAAKDANNKYKRSWTQMGKGNQLPRTSPTERKYCWGDKREVRKIHALIVEKETISLSKISRDMKAFFAAN